MGAIDLEDVYDEATLARIDKVPPSRRGAEIGALRRHSVAGAMAVGLAAGLHDVFEPPTAPVIETVDPWKDGGRSPRVRFHWHPVPWCSVAEVLW